MCERGRAYKREKQKVSEREGDIIKVHCSTEQCRTARYSTLQYSTEFVPAYNPLTPSFLMSFTKQSMAPVYSRASAGWFIKRVRTYTHTSTSACT